ncbi:MAG: radical SAM protein [Candidatus Lernaella stagnicola]|nr:radical SAM protein [Candidatus Lernaella stagnicola]
MRLALIHPPEPMKSIASEVCQHPINLAQLAAYVRDRLAVEVEIWDYGVLPYSPEHLRENVTRFQPQIVGFSAMTPLVRTAAQLAAVVKECDRNIVTIVGGPHVSALPERTLAEFESFDLGVIGEGELTLAELCADVQRGRREWAGVAGTVYRDDGDIRVAPSRPLIANLDDLSYPARDLLDFSLYQGSSSPGLSSKIRNITELFTSRGCPVRCFFCASHVTHRGRVRFRSARHVLGEVRECVERFGIEHFTIDDDTFTFGRQRLLEIVRGLREMNVSWDCDSRVTNVDAALLREMAASGCVKIAFGVESGSPRMLEAVRKKITLPQVEAAFDGAKRAGILTAAFIMIGAHPSETAAEVEQTFRLMLRIRPDFVMVYLAVPFPGTDLYEAMRREGMLLSEDWDEFDIVRGEPVWRTEHFSPAQLIALQRSMYRRIYLRPGFVLRKLAMIKSGDDLRYFADAFVKFIKYIFGKRREVGVGGKGALDGAAAQPRLDAGDSRVATQTKKA